MSRCSRLALGFLTIVLGAVEGCSTDSGTQPQAVCDVTNPVSRISVVPSSATVYFRLPVRSTDTLLLTPTAYNRFGGARTDVRFAYSSSDTSVAVVSPTGVLYIVGAGTTSVHITACGQSASAEVTAVPAVATVAVRPTPDTLVAGDSIMLTARAIGHDGAPMSDVVFSWADPPAELVVVRPVSDSTAWVRANGAGLASVTARGEGAGDSASVLVLPRVFLSGAAASAPGLDAGSDYTCGIISLGRAYCWGVDDEGQLGAGADSSCFGDTRSQIDTTSEHNSVTKKCSLLPQRFASSLSFTTVSAGDMSACGIASTGLAYCWGRNDFGQLGNGLTGSGATPKLVTGAQVFVSITVGGSHACGLTAGGSAYCWGSDEHGELGDGRTINSSTPIPVIIDQAGGGPATFTSLSAGFRHTCGVASDGTSYCWGDNTSGEIGTATSESCPGAAQCSSIPVAVAAPSGVRFTAVSAGADHTCAITSGGSAYCWGSDSKGQLGDGTIGGARSTPAIVTGGNSFSQITAGTRYTCALQGTAAYCWGDGGDLQLGRGPFSGGDGASANPAAVVGGHGFKRISAGSRHTCAVGTDGKAYCWGSNVFGALGNTLQAAYRGTPQVVATPY